MQTNPDRENFGSAKLPQRGIFDGKFTANSIDPWGAAICTQTQA
jgi:hypothetical protein